MCNQLISDQSRTETDARGASCNFGWGCTVLNHAKLRTRKRKTHRRYQGSPGGNGATRGSQLANYSPCIESYVTIVVLLRSYAIVEDRCLLGKNKSLTRNGLHSMWCVVHARCKYCTVQYGASEPRCQVLPYFFPVRLQWLRAPLYSSSQSCWNLDGLCWCPHCHQ